jgi:hypothetical protein
MKQRIIGIVLLIFFCSSNIFSQAHDHQAKITSCLEIVTSNDDYKFKFNNKLYPENKDVFICLSDLPQQIQIVDDQGNTISPNNVSWDNNPYVAVDPNDLTIGTISDATNDNFGSDGKQDI